jgi:hypothetical protein
MFQLLLSGFHVLIFLASFFIFMAQKFLFKNKNFIKGIIEAKLLDSLDV